ncbi:MAG: flagellar biosynthesis repressor FlbT [Pseudomonadota bacterium]|nr:flagellar biosynthesis repressor FlbT [Pseudomonadota bacterium]
MNITLRAGERIYINGAVLRVDRKATLELMNDATFLLETHVMQAQDATTPLRQIYFVVQVMLMDPASARATTQLAASLIAKAQEAFDSAQIRRGLESVSDFIGRTRYFEAMKALRVMYPLEQAEMFPAGDAHTSHAA